MAKVGTLTFDTDLDTKNLEKKIKNAEKALEQFDNKNNKLNKQKIQLKVDTEDSLKKIDELNTRLEFLRKKSDIIEQQIAGAKTPLAKQQLELQLDKNITEQDQILVKQESINEEIKKNAQLYDEINNKLAYNEKAQGHIRDNIKGMRNELSQVQQQQNDINDEEKKGGGFGNKLKDYAKKITIIGLGLAGLRMGVSLLRNAVGTLAGQNDEIATKINTIKSAIANALAPAVQFVLNLFKTLLAYVGYIIKAWTGRDIFKNSAKSTKKMKNNLGGANKEASKLKRTLAGFDEMNILQKDGGVSTGGGGGGISPSDVDMSMFEDVEIPDWVKWIADNKDKILEWIPKIGAAIAVVWGMIKGYKIMQSLEDTTTWVGKLSAGLEGITGAQFLTFLGKAVVAVGGFLIALKGFFDLITDIANGTASLGNVLVDLGEILLGLGIAFAAMNASNPLGWIAIGIGLVSTITGLFIEEEGTVRQDTYALEKNAGARKSLNEASQEYIGAHSKYVNAVKAEKKAHEELTEIEKKNKMSGKELYDEVIRGELSYDKMSTKQKQVYEAYLRYYDKTIATTKAQQEMTEAEHEQAQAYINQQAEIARTTGKYEEFEKTLKQMFDSGKINADDMHDAIQIAFEGVEFTAKQTFVNNLPSYMRETFITVDKGIKKMNEYAAAIDKANKQADKLQKVYKYIGFLDFSKYAKGGIVGYAKGGVVDLPKLAPGGLINRPGPGVAIGGERGTEGVVPLTDSQQMARLGEAIGKWVNIRAEIPVSVGNRQIAREIRNINAAESFAFNG